VSDYYPATIDYGPLFATRAPAARGSVTSAQAADSLGPATLNEMQRRVLELLRENPHGMTDEEMQLALGMNPSTQRPRRIELVRRGLVVECGTRRTASGRMASVWKATAASR
jgi:transcription initiation factor IIE alpha subunit